MPLPTYEEVNSQKPQPKVERDSSELTLLKFKQLGDVLAELSIENVDISAEGFPRLVQYLNDKSGGNKDTYTQLAQLAEIPARQISLILASGGIIIDNYSEENIFFDFPAEGSDHMPVFVDEEHPYIIMKGAEYSAATGYQPVIEKRGIDTEMPGGKSLFIFGQIKDKLTMYNLPMDPSEVVNGELVGPTERTQVALETQSGQVISIKQIAEFCRVIVQANMQKIGRMPSVVSSRTPSDISGIILADLAGQNV